MFQSQQTTVRIHLVLKNASDAQEAARLFAGGGGIALAVDGGEHRLKELKLMAEGQQARELGVVPKLLARGGSGRHG